MAETDPSVLDTDIEHLPGVGASLGLYRLIDAMEDLELLQKHNNTPAPVFIVYFVEEELGRYISLARDLRQAGIDTELYPEPRGIGKQLKYADRKGFRIALIGGPDELEKGVWQVKDLERGSSEEIATAELPDELKRMLQ